MDVISAPGLTAAVGPRRGLPSLRGVLQHDGVALAGLLGDVTGEAEGLKGGNAALHAVEEEYPLVGFFVDGGLGEGCWRGS